MTDLNAEIDRLAEEFEESRKLIRALSDETRQNILLQMLRMKRIGGVQASEITKESHLSRPAVSHHIQILRDAGILKMRREGTMRFYCFDTVTLYRMQQMLEHAARIVEQLQSQIGD